MKTSAAGVEFVAEHEGWVNHIYKDVAGIDTIGYGHVVRPGENFAPIITKEKGLSLLAQDLGIAEHAVNVGVTVEITQNQFDALVSFTFNMGGGAFASSTLLKKLNAGDVVGAADEILRWNKTMINGVKTVHPGLTRRRQQERAVFLTPDVAEEPPVVEEPVTPEPVVPQPAPLDPAPVIVVPPAPVVPAPSTLKALIDFIVMLFSAFFGKKN